MKKIYSIIVLLTAVSICSLQAKDPKWWVDGKRCDREKNCNYRQECPKYCDDATALSCDCNICFDPRNSSAYENSFEEEDEEEKELAGFLLGIYRHIVGKKGGCKFEEKCFRYGYCPSCNCPYSLTHEEVREALDAILNEDLR